MSVYHDIKTSRRFVLIGVVFGYAAATMIAVANLRSDDGTVLTALAFLAVFSLPASVALLSLDRRPSLLTLASMSALVQGVILFTSGGVVLWVSAIVWYVAAQRRPRPALDPRGSAWIRPLLAISTVLPVLVMFIHLDPTCTVTTPDGVIRTYEDEDAAKGWSLQLGSSSETSTADGETTTCTTNIVVPWEAIASIALSSAFIVLIWQRWPTAQDLVDADVPALSGEPGPQ